MFFHHKPKQKPAPRALFILKRREDYSTDIPNFNALTVTTGMYNSAKFVNDMLIESGIMSDVVVVTDNNDIDREVTRFRPTHVFIEGLWVVPSKFKQLKPLHPTVTWVVRCHSEMPFLAQEGVALDWIADYVRGGVFVSSNSPRINRELQIIVSGFLNKSIEDVEALVPLLMNYYEVSSFRRPCYFKDDVLDIGCFGAVRPMKNHLMQAVAAYDFARSHGRGLRFHINAGRIEMNGNNPLKNLRALFKNLVDAELVEHPWMSHEDFLHVLKHVDIAMQVSFSETYNIVTADAITVGTPVLTSAEVPFVYPIYADPTSTVDITRKLHEVWTNRQVYTAINKEYLKRYSASARSSWLGYLNGIDD